MNLPFNSYICKLDMPNELQHAVIDLRKLCMESEDTKQLSEEITSEESAMITAIGRDIVRKVTEYMNEHAESLADVAKYMNTLFNERSGELKKNSEKGDKYVDMLKNSLCSFLKTAGINPDLIN